MGKEKFPKSRFGCLRLTSYQVSAVLIKNLRKPFAPKKTVALLQGNEFKKGAKVKPISARTWGYICGIPGPIHLSGVYTVEEDSRPHFPGCSQMMRLKEMAGVKFIAGDFHAAT